METPAQRRHSGKRFQGDPWPGQHQARGPWRVQRHSCSLWSQSCYSWGVCSFPEALCSSDWDKEWDQSWQQGSLNGFKILSFVSVCTRNQHLHWHFHLCLQESIRLLLKWFFRAMAWLLSLVLKTFINAGPRSAMYATFRKIYVYRPFRRSFPRQRKLI